MKLQNRTSILVMCSHFLKLTKKEPGLLPWAKCIPSGWNECLPHAPMSGTHNVQHYLDHLEFCGLVNSELRHLHDQETCLFPDIPLLGDTEARERKCIHSKRRGERWKSTKRKKTKQTQLWNRTGYWSAVETGNKKWVPHCLENPLNSELFRHRPRQRPVCIS